MSTPPNPYLNGQNSETPQERVLVVDDEVNMQCFLREALATLGFAVEVASNVANAQQYLQESEFEVILTDVVMPGATGVDLLRWSRRLNRPPAFILMTGNAQTEMVVEALNMGAHFFIRKPFKLRELQEALSSVLAKRRYEQTQAEFRQHLEATNATLRQKVIDAVVQQETLFLGCLSALAETIDARDPYTRRHSASVASLARLMARKMKLSSEEVHAAETAGILHDIGKIAVPETILQKPSKLTDVEFSVMQQHPERAAQMLTPVPGLDTAIPAIQAHHERFDGQGYPSRIAGLEIPLLARVLSICDTWDAMTSDRPYRKALPVQVASEEIEAYKGKQFDPELADIFLELVSDGVIKSSQEFQEVH